MQEHVQVKRIGIPDADAISKRLKQGVFRKNLNTPCFNVWRYDIIYLEKNLNRRNSK